jgi:transformation/transcription domain-associated protein
MFRVNTGQYRGDQEPEIEQHIMLQKFEPDVMVQNTNYVYSRRLGLRGSDGKVYYFSVMATSPHMTHSDERWAQMYNILNWLMGKYKETRKRQLVYTIPRIVSITNRVRLCETPEADINMGEVWKFCRFS